MKPNDVAVWTADTLARVFPFTPPPNRPVSQSAAEVKMCAAAGEYESGQIALRPRRELSEVTAKVVGILPDEVQVELFWALPVMAEEYPCPDPLVPAGAFTLRADTTHVLWVRAHVGRRTKPGQAEATVRVTSQGQTVADVPLCLTVWDFQLPEHFSIGLNYRLNPSRLAEQFGVELWSNEFFALTRQAAADLAAHGQDCITVHGACHAYEGSMIRWQFDLVGRLSLDFTVFDRWVATFREVGIEERMEVSSLYSAHRPDAVRLEIWDKRSAELHTEEVAVGSDRYESLMIDFLEQLRAHLEQIGWDGDCLIKVAHEPGAEERAAWVSAARLVRDRNADLLLTDDFALPQRELRAMCDVWVMNAWYFDDGFLVERQTAGDEVQIYHPADCSSPNASLHNTLLEVRLIPWLNWSKGLDGLVRQGYCDWHTDPWQDPQCGTALAPASSYLIYPDREHRGLISSIRWEVLRDGIEDYEYLCLASDWLDDKRLQRHPRAQELRAALNEAIERVVIGDRLTNDPAVLRSARQALAKAIVELSALVEPEV